MSQYAVVDPSTNEVVRRYDTATDAEAAAALDDAAAAYPAWRSRSVGERAELLRDIARAHRERREELAAIITREMGKTTREALGEVDLSAAIYDWHADNADRLLAEQPIDTRRATAVVQTVAVGPVLGIMPWNYPYYQVARFAAPNLLLGNTVLLKHAPSCPESAEAIASMIHAAGVPAGAYVNLRATDAQIAELIGRPELQGVSLTGSERAGRAVGELAGRAMKKVVLELGGSDPFIVLADADVPAAARAAVIGRMGNAGQACTASKRIIVVDDVYEAFMAAFTAGVEQLTIGDPASGVDMGPLSSERAAQAVVSQIDDAVAHGASVLVGGGRLDRPGAFVAPTVLADVPETSRAFHEEIFGPVAVVHRVADVEAAIALANATSYGLGSVVFGAEGPDVDAVADRLEVGMVTVNGPGITSPELPFGGVKASGVGRELGALGILEFANRKLVRRVLPRD